LGGGSFKHEWLKEIGAKTKPHGRKATWPKELVPRIRENELGKATVFEKHPGGTGWVRNPLNSPRGKKNNVRKPANSDFQKNTARGEATTRFLVCVTDSRKKRSRGGIQNHWPRGWQETKKKKQTNWKRPSGGPKRGQQEREKSAGSLGKYLDWLRGGG